MERATDNKPWWKELWPWLLMAGPAVAIIGCGITIWLALSGAEAEITQGFTKQGLKVEQVSPGAQGRP